jgi:two-component system CheB/CheR fusion protein
VQVFATDIDEHALGVARAARYPTTLLDSISPERRERFFVPEGGSYVVAKEVRDLCIFSPHSVLRDPPFSRIDLVSCRNLLIYFGLDVQNQVIPTFHYALRPQGYLFLGTSETISHFSDLFTVVDKKHRIFRRRSGETSGLPLPAAIRSLRPGPVTVPHTRRMSALTGGGSLRHAIESQVLERFSPPYVVVNREGEIVFYSARTGKYLELAAGAPTRQILSHARKGLRLDLQASFRQAVETGRPVTREGIAVDSDDERVQMITLTVAPVSDCNRDDPLFLILFADQGPTLSREEAISRAHTMQDGAALQLERELRDTRERLQSMSEEYETALEELKSSNEELVATNEELQSSNEELETSKEELQSVNEELHTINVELNGKIEALDQANNDLQNLFDSTDVAAVFLSQNLMIRSFTPAATRIFHLLPGDRGRPITDLSSAFSLPELTKDIAEVLAGRGPIERRAAHPRENAHYLVRLGPYRNGEGKTVGVVVTFIDVTGLTRAEAQQRVLLAEVQHRTRNLLAVVQSMATQTLGKGGPLAEFLTRLAALGRVQGLISRSSGDAFDLAEIVRLELEAHGAHGSGKVTATGPPVALGLTHVQTLALALHELATNAVKYGALKQPNGKLEIVWTLRQHGTDERLLVLDWRESGVAMPPDSSRRGYGRKLIEQALTFTLRAGTELAFGEDGVSCRIEVPLPSRVPGGLEQPVCPGLAADLARNQPVSDAAVASADAPAKPPPTRH